MQSTNSEVARLLTQINSEYEAARQGLSGLSQGSSQHQFMTKRTERMAELYFQLGDTVGDEAMKEILDGDQGGGQEPELVAIGEQLQATASYAVDPAFKERLQATCLQQYREMMRV